MSGLSWTRSPDYQHSHRPSRLDIHQPPTVPTAMAIPRVHAAVPPPLPPPIHLPDLAAGHDPGWQWGNDPNGSDFGRAASVKPGSSLLGGAMFPARFSQGRDHDFTLDFTHRQQRRNVSTSSPLPNGDSEMTDVVRAHDSVALDGAKPPPDYSNFPCERQLEQKTQEASSNSYDKHLLSRIERPSGPSTPERAPGSLSQCATALASRIPADIERRNIQLRPLSFSDRQPGSLDSPASSRWPPSGDVSPRYAKTWSETESSETSRVHTRNGSLTFDDSASHRGSYDQSMFSQEDLMDDSHMSHLQIHDRSPYLEHLQATSKFGTKRRASSPPGENARDERVSISSTSGQSEGFARKPVQPCASRYSPGPKLSGKHSSISSVSSYGLRAGSLGSSLGIGSMASSMTSYASGQSSLGYDADHHATVAVKSHPGISSPPASSYHPGHEEFRPAVAQKALTNQLPHAAGIHGVARLTGMYICDCCPKKPKKFDTKEELELHEAEKQYTCAYCPNRFKNKNEAERHQNSLHLRRHSWSCATLASVEAAFHTSPVDSSMDVCGYCGDEFPNPPQWEIRGEHLNIVHKFGECNQNKKFFRADHFRQHLKHSHAGTSGKWTNLLENACMKDEPLGEDSSGPPTPPMSEPQA